MFHQHNEERAASGYGVYESFGQLAVPSLRTPPQPPVGAKAPTPLPRVGRLRLRSSYGAGARSNVAFRLPPELTGRVITLNAALPNFPIPSMPALGFVEVGGLWRLDEKAEPLLSAVLGAMSFVKGPGANDPQTGQTVFMLGQMSGDGMTTVRGYIQAGYAALLDKASPATGVLQWVFTASPAIVLARAGGPGATHALVDDEPAPVIAAASALASGGSQLPGTITAPDGTAVVGPGGTATPKWVVPALIGAGVLVVGAIAYAGRKR